jgi:hypothetical protein
MKTGCNLLLAICVATLAACGDQAPAATANPHAAVTAALNTACPGLKTHARDIVLSSPVRAAADLTTARERGWTNVYNITAKVSDRPSPRVADEFKAIGQHCTFSIEAAQLGTVAVSKSACMAICKDKAPAGERLYLAYFGVDGSEQLMR